MMSSSLFLLLLLLHHHVDEDEEDDDVPGLERAGGRVGREDAAQVVVAAAKAVKAGDRDPHLPPSKSVMMKKRKKRPTYAQEALLDAEGEAIALTRLDGVAFKMELRDEGELQARR